MLAADVESARLRLIEALEHSGNGYRIVIRYPGRNRPNRGNRGVLRRGLIMRNAFCAPSSIRRHVRPEFAHTANPADCPHVSLRGRMAAKSAFFCDRRHCSRCDARHTDLDPCMGMMD